MGKGGSKLTEGYHVLKIHPSSPAEKAGLVPFFDFVISANDIVLNSEDIHFGDIVSKEEGKDVRLKVYNSKLDTTRTCVLVPRRDWGGPGLIGATIRFASVKGANENVWHVLDVYPDSPASAAGFEPHTDYIVGTPDVLFNDAEDFFTLVSSNVGKPTKLYVYSTKTDNVRSVTITPSRDWGGNGVLGCDVGYGLMHRIPIAASALPHDENDDSECSDEEEEEDEEHHGHSHEHGHSHDHGHSHSHGHSHEPATSKPPPASPTPSKPPAPSATPSQPEAPIPPPVSSSPPQQPVALPTTPAPQPTAATIATPPAPSLPPAPAAPAAEQQPPSSAPLPISPTPTPAAVASAAPAALPVSTPSPQPPAGSTSPQLPSAAAPPVLPASPVLARTVSPSSPLPAPEPTPSVAAPPPPLPSVAPALPSAAPPLPPATPTSPAAGGAATNTPPESPARPSAVSPNTTAQLAALQQLQHNLKNRLEELQKKAKAAAK